MQQTVIISVLAIVGYCRLMNTSHTVDDVCPYVSIIAMLINSRFSVHLLTTRFSGCYTHGGHNMPQLRPGMPSPSWYIAMPGTVDGFQPTDLDGIAQWSTSAMAFHVHLLQQRRQVKRGGACVDMAKESILYKHMYDMYSSLSL